MPEVRRCGVKKLPGSADTGSIRTRKKHGLPAWQVVNEAFILTIVYMGVNSYSAGCTCFQKYPLATWCQPLSKVGKKQKKPGTQAGLDGWQLKASA